MGRLAMRTALLTTALMMMATVTLADEPPAPATQPEAAATTTTTETATSATATESTAAVVDNKKPLRPPQGYRPKRVNGEQVWCAKVTVMGSKFAKEDCRNEAELRELIRTRESMRTDMEQRTRVCASAGGCAMN